MKTIAFLSLAATGVGLFFIQDRLPSQVVLILMVVWVLGMRKLAMNATQDDINKIVTEQEAERARSLGFADVNALNASAPQLAAAEQTPADTAEGKDEEPGKPRRRRAQRA